MSLTSHDENGCHGNGEDHCCYLGKYGVCQYVEENTVPGRRWTCGLYRELGSWEAVYADRRYQTSDAGRFMAERFPGYGCGDWPQNIPDVMQSTKGKCCYHEAEVTLGNVG
jgi:hypothetical protein